MAKPKKPQQINFEARARLTSPIVRARWPRLNDPDTTYKADGVYKVTLELDMANPEHAAFVAELETFAAEAKAEAEREFGDVLAKVREERPKMSLPWKVSEEDPAIILLSTKMNATRMKEGTSIPQRPALFSKDGTPYVGTDWVRGGSEVRANFMLRPWLSALGFGVSAMLNAVQIIKLADSNKAERYGFEAVNDEANPEQGWDYDGAQS